MKVNWVPVHQSMWQMNLSIHKYIFSIEKQQRPLPHSVKILHLVSSLNTRRYCVPHHSCPRPVNEMPTRVTGPVNDSIVFGDRCEAPGRPRSARYRCLPRVAIGSIMHAGRPGLMCVGERPSDLATGLTSAAPCRTERLAKIKDAYFPPCVIMRV